MSGAVKLKVENHIAHIVLGCPDQLNSLSPLLVESLLAALVEAEGNPEAKAIILSGEGKAFCAGGDLSSMRGFAGVKEITHYMQMASKLTKTILDLEKLVISAVHGYAAGAGFSLALASDFIVADCSAKFALRFKNVGLIPDLGLMKLLSERVPVQLAKEWVVSGKTITAEEALQHGIINRLADHDVTEAAVEFAESMVKGPPLIQRYVKFLFRHSNQLDWEATLHQENLIQSLLIQSKDHQEGIAAFYEKRAPHFKGE
ncbi:enoyl-CoA hydratase/isomerase family protein [Brevibacillus choshinensis]|uniref:enoyl-CoA hydratase/isomerase family protein n=1 Tax=Brevibacillus choshinensis TaxID=54911 RepID=UPI002E24999A|nr:enoyl-CoA hydratase/isomerase family protein [Brevibacillus choshinensis]MED4753245.1 enoyl-CoA hydratase/isomerase family protein [Brevibacillus choshinensis]MED4782328.1 enoyl-CoA hydratase/isomerase family protein [Brevibacillus choshinensis]